MELGRKKVLSILVFILIPLGQYLSAQNLAKNLLKNQASLSQALVLPTYAQFIKDPIDTFDTFIASNKHLFFSSSVADFSMAAHDFSLGADVQKVIYNNFWNYFVDVPELTGKITSEVVDVTIKTICGESFVFELCALRFLEKSGMVTLDCTNIGGIFNEKKQKYVLGSFLIPQSYREVSVDDSRIIWIFDEVKNHNFLSDPKMIQFYQKEPIRRYSQGSNYQCIKP